MISVAKKNMADVENGVSVKAKPSSKKLVWVLLFFVLLIAAAAVTYLKFPGIFKRKANPPPEPDKNLFKISSEHPYLMTLETYGDSAERFNNPKFMAADKDGFIYVGDTGSPRWSARSDSTETRRESEAGSSRILKFDSNGKFIKEWNTAEEEATLTGMFGLAADDDGNIYATNCYNIIKYDSGGKFLKKWGDFGTEGGGNFNGWANGIAADGAGNIYVGDPNNFRIQKFNSTGDFLRAWGTSEQFNIPYGITADNSGNVYVADTFNHRIQKFDPNGEFILKWGGRGTDAGQFIQPSGLATDGKRNIYVADSMNNRVQKFDSNGNFIAKWGTAGAGDGQLNFPCGVAVYTDKKSSKEYIYITDSKNNRIYKLTDGSPLHAEAIAEADKKTAEAAKNEIADSEPKTTNYIYGKVLSIEGKPIKNVTLKFSNDAGLEMREFTDGDGVYKSERLPFGMYRLKVWEESYQPVIKNIEIKAGPPKEHNFKLSRWD